MKELDLLLHLVHLRDHVSRSHGPFKLRDTMACVGAEQARVQAFWVVLRVDLCVRAVRAGRPLAAGQARYGRRERTTLEGRVLIQLVGCFWRRPLDAEFCRRRIETSPMVVEGAELSLGAQNKSLIQEKHRGQGSYAGHVPRRTTTFTTLSRREVWYKSQTKVVVTRDVFCEGGRPCALRLPGPALGVLSAFPLPNIASECLHPLGPHLFTPVPNQTPQT